MNFQVTTPADIKQFRTLDEALRYIESIGVPQGLIESIGGPSEYVELEIRTPDGTWNGLHSDMVKALYETPVGDRDHRPQLRSTVLRYAGLPEETTPQRQYRWITALGTMEEPTTNYLLALQTPPGPGAELLHSEDGTTWRNAEGVVISEAPDSAERLVRIFLNEHGSQADAEFAFRLGLSLGRGLR